MDFLEQMFGGGVQHAIDTYRNVPNDPDHPVVIWQWAADFDADADADAEGRSRFGERYPHSQGVWLFSSS